jgi:alpha-beta hydrolase superfamily lysophospholipase
MAERSGYIPISGEHVYVVCHDAEVARVAEVAGASPRGNVVLAGPMSLERTHSYAAFVRLARFLASEGYCVWRFDYRGVGESTGDFSRKGFDDWRDDLRAVVTAARENGHPVAVIGLRLGALLGHALLDSGEIDALVAWEPPTDGRSMLMEMLRRKLAADYASGGERRTRDEYVQELREARIVEVEGFPWSLRMFESADAYRSPKPSEANAALRWASIHADGRPRDDQGGTVFSVSIPKPVFWTESPHLRPDLTALFERTLLLVARLLESATRGDPAIARAGDSARLPARGAQREVFTLSLPSGSGTETLVGTAHVPATRRGTVGILFLNFGYVPRDGHGGLAAHAADALAAEGMPAFRVDLPTLGDSTGLLPERAQQFYDLVTAGGFTEAAVLAAEEIRRRFDLSGLVLGGLCGGAVTATFVAEQAPKLVKALVLLEPEMYLVQPPTAKVATARDDAPVPLAKRLLASLDERLPRRLRRLRQQAFSYWGWMRVLTLEGRYGHLLPLPRKLILDLVMDRTKLPAVTNLKLAAAWRSVVARDVPVLVITADGKMREIFFDRINAVVLSGLAQRRVDHARLKRTNHIFTSGGALEAVLSHLLPWSRAFSARSGS